MEKLTRRRLYNELEISSAVTRIAQQLSHDYKDLNPIFLCVLKGSIHFYSDLIREFEGECEMEFIRISSYIGTNTTGSFKSTGLSLDKLSNRHIIIVEDIIDTGLTMQYLLENVTSCNPASAVVVSLLDKPCRRLCNIKPDYVGYEVDDKFIVGYGMDYNERFRNLPYIDYIEIESESKIK